MKTSIERSKLSFLILALLVVIEGPIRLLLQPDPWLLHPSHWYFHQPMRLFIEAVIVLCLALVLSQSYKNLLTMSKENTSLLIGAAIGTIVLFSFLELDQLTASMESPLSNILVWGATGFLIGVGQELIYRGLLYTSLCDFFSNNVAAFTTTVIFVIAPLHSVRMWDLFEQGNYSVVIMLTFIYVAASYFFQWLRDKSQSIVVPSIAHGLGNGITWLAVFS